MTAGPQADTAAHEPAPAHARERRLQLLLTCIAAAASLLAAGLGIAASRSVASFEAAAEDRRVTSAQRLSAYSELLTEAELFVTRLTRLDPCAATGSSQRDPEWEAASDQADDVRLAVARVFLVATDNVSARALDVRQNAANLFEAHRRAEADNAERCLAEASARTNGVRELNDKLRLFANDARAELTGDVVVQEN